MTRCLVNAVLLLSVVNAFEFSVTIADKIYAPNKKGRIILYISRNNDTALLTQGDDGPQTCQMFGKDAFDLAPGESATFDDSILGYPRESLKDIPSGDYFVQAEFKLYDVYRRGDGEELVLPASCVAPGDDGSYGLPAGHLYSTTQKVTIDRNAAKQVKIMLEHKQPKLPGAGCAGNGIANSKYIKTVHVKSEQLSKFWGRDIILEACVLLPWGFAEHPDARYPLVIAHSHYSDEFDAGGRFREHPPENNVTGYEKTDLEYAYYLYKNWTDPDGVFKGARMLLAIVNHPVPFFDDSYAVNSPNTGPYGDAITYELVPAIEKQFRGIGQGWARALHGGSTGGWESIGVQVKYPDDYNGAYAACPDPITFTHYTTVDLYKDRNAYFYDSDWKHTPKPGYRDHYDGQTAPGTTDFEHFDGYATPYGQTTATVEEMNRHELVLGEHSRSCGQWDIWEAVFGPKGADGYPARVWDKRTGVINKTVVKYWRENYDLQYIMKRDWKTLGPKLAGKIHLFVGGGDSFFLTNAVMDMQDWLETTKAPYYNGSVTIGTHDGRGFQHCFSGYLKDPKTGEELPNSITRELYNQRFMPEMATHFAATAPKGADTTSWRY